MGCGDAEISSVNGFVGAVGVDKSIDRRILEQIIAAMMADREARYRIDCHDGLNSALRLVPRIVEKLASSGYLTPEEIKLSPSLCKAYSDRIEQAKREEEEARAVRAEAKRKALEALKRAEAAAAECGDV